MIVTMALITTLAMPPMLRWALARLPVSEEERERMKRDAFAERSFVGSFERLLIAVDESVNATFASRLGGLLAGSVGLSATVLHLVGRVRESNGQGQANAAAGEMPDESLKSAAESSKAATTTSTEADSPVAADVIVRRPDAPIGEAVAAEARKGYDLLVVGIDRPVLGDGRLVRDLADIAAGFDGPFAITDARGIHLERPLERRLRILVPVNGTETSRRALEIAASLAVASEGRLTALYVSNTRRRARGFSLERLRSIEDQELILKDAAAIAEEHGAEARTIVTSGDAPEEAILRYARRARYDLVVMGVSRRPGERLYFGESTETVLQKSERSLLLVSS
jgi:nucleotide-binding universal stress UspA family protein